MEILVLGGTGAMGAHIVDILSKNNNVYVTSRRKQEDRANVKFLQGNAKSMTFLNEICALKHWDSIVDFMAYNTAQLKERIDLLLNSTNQYVFISSARVYADSKDLITEDSDRLLDVCTDQEYLKTDEYSLSKARQEDILLSSKKTNWTIIRPSLTYSEIRLQLGAYEKENWLYRALKGRSIVFSKDLMDVYYTLSYGKDTSKGIASIVGRAEALGEAYHVVQDCSFQWKDILNVYLDRIEAKTGVRPNVILTEKCTNLEIPSAKYQVLYGRYCNRFFDNSKIKEYVDTSEWLTPDEGLKMCIDKFLENPQFLNINWQKEALIDRAAKEWTPLREIPGKRMKLNYLKWRIFGV